MGGYYVRVGKGDTRSLDYGSCACGSSRRESNSGGCNLLGLMSSTSNGNAQDCHTCPGGGGDDDGGTLNPKP